MLFVLCTCSRKLSPLVINSTWQTTCGIHFLKFILYGGDFPCKKLVFGEAALHSRNKLLGFEGFLRLLNVRFSLLIVKRRESNWESKEFELFSFWRKP